MKVRAFLWTAHRWIGLACALPFLVLAVTGLAMLACHAAGLGDTMKLDHPVSDASGIDQALTAARAAVPGSAPGLLLPGIDSNHAWAIQLRTPGGDQRTAEVDPAKGRLLQIRRAGSGTEETLLLIHNSLALGGAGRIVILATAASVLLLSFSGFTIMRRRWRTLRDGPLAGPMRLRRLHHWTGLVGLAFLLLWATTGSLLLLMKGGGSGRPHARPPVVQSCPPAAIAPILAAALRRYPTREIQGVMLGAQGGPVAVILLDRDAPPWAKSTTLMFDGCTGAMKPPRSTPAVMQMMIAAKSLHTGLWGRGPALLFYLAAAVLPLLLGLSGPWLWLRRRLHSRSKVHRA